MEQLCGHPRDRDLAKEVIEPLERSKLDHCPPDNFTRPKQVNELVDLIERDGLDRVADLALSGKRHDLTQVGIIAPEGAVEGLFARNSREQPLQPQYLVQRCRSLLRPHPRWFRPKRRVLHRPSLT